MDIIPQTCSINSYRSSSIPDYWFWKILLIKGLYFFIAFSQQQHHGHYTCMKWLASVLWIFWIVLFIYINNGNNFFWSVMKIAYVYCWLGRARANFDRVSQTKITVITTEFQKKGKYLCEPMRTQSETKQTAGKCGRPNRDWIKVSDWLRLANHRAMYRETNANSDSSSTTRKYGIKYFFLTYCSVDERCCFWLILA